MRNRNSHLANFYVVLALAACGSVVGASIAAIAKALEAHPICVYAQGKKVGCGGGTYVIHQDGSVSFRPPAKTSGR